MYATVTVGGIAGWRTDIVPRVLLPAVVLVLVIVLLNDPTAVNIELLYSATHP